MVWIKHGTLVANVVTTVTLDRDAKAVLVTNRDGAAEIFIGIDGVVPTVGGDDLDMVPAAIAQVRVDSRKPGATVVKLISAGTPAFQVKVAT